MDIHQFLDRYPALKTYRIPIVLAVISLLFIGYGIFLNIDSSSNTSGDVIFEEASAAENTQVSEILVDIQGAVIKPGVYKVSGSSRLNEVILKAGGFSEEADYSFIAKNINLATKVKDGFKLYVPFKGEGTVVSNSSNSEGSFTPFSEKININTASTKTLESLPGIGVVTAEKIISGRPYESIEELLSKKIVGPSVYEDIKDQISVY